MKKITAVILAAGKGTRMKSAAAKVLHSLAGRPMIEHVLQAVTGAGIDQVVVVVGHQAERVRQRLGEKYSYVLQTEQLGTGHAVRQTVQAWPKHGETVLVLCGDTPLITSQTIAMLVKEHEQRDSACTVLTAEAPDPTGYGRVIRDENDAVASIVEEKDANEKEKMVREINTGGYCFRQDVLAEAIKQLTPANAQGEYYLTDVIAYCRERELAVTACKLNDYREMQGINNRVQLAEAGAVLRLRINHRLMLAGVTIISPDSTYIDDGVEVGADTTILPNTHLTGHTSIGGGCLLGPDTTINDSSVGMGTAVQNSVIKESRIGDNCNIGPFSYIRPGTVLGDGVKIGDFVEIKKSIVGAGSKIPHLSYVGDAEIGESVNIGAGTITCNYDGTNKWKTVIEDWAFIGSNTNLVAPVTVGGGAVVGAGSTITKDVPEGSLAVARGRQKNLDDRGKKHSNKGKKEQNKEE